MPKYRFKPIKIDTVLIAPGCDPQYTEKIIQQVSEERIKTEHLHTNANISLFSIRLNKASRALCTIKKLNMGDILEDCLVVIDIDLNHKYDLKKLQEKKFLQDLDKILSQPMQIENLGSSVFGSQNPDGEVIIYSREQAKAIENNPIRKGHTGIDYAIVNGLAGSGKTTVAEAILRRANEEGGKTLYVSKSENLVSEAQKKFQSDSGIDCDSDAAVDNETAAAAKSVECLTYKQLIPNEILLKFLGDFIDAEMSRADLSKKNVGDNSILQLYHYLCKTEAENKDNIRGLKSLLEEFHFNKDCGDEDIENVKEKCLTAYFEKTLSNRDQFISWFKTSQNKEIKKIKQAVLEYMTSTKRELPKEEELLGELYFEVQKSNIVLGRRTLYAKLHHQSDAELSLASKIKKKYMDYLSTNKKIDPSFISLPDYFKNHLEMKSSKDASYDGKYDDDSKASVIVIDEAQNFSNLEIENIIAYITKTYGEDSLVYLCRDGNQSLEDPFDLTLQTMYDLTNKQPMATYNLGVSYRTPPAITTLANEWLKIKSHVIGGKLNSADSTRSSDGDDFSSRACNEGYIKFITDRKDKAIKDLEQSTKNILESIVIIFNDDDMQNARNLFPDALILKPKDVVGLEYEKVILYNPFGHESLLSLYKVLEDLDLDSKAPIYRPKALCNLQYVKYFNEFFVAITRSKSDLFILDLSNQQSRYKGFFEKRFNIVISKYSDDAESASLSDLSLADLIERTKAFSQRKGFKEHIDLALKMIKEDQSSDKSVLAKQLDELLKLLEINGFGQGSDYFVKAIGLRKTLSPPTDTATPPEQSKDAKKASTNQESSNHAHGKQALHTSKAAKEAASQSFTKKRDKKPDKKGKKSEVATSNSDTKSTNVVPSRQEESQKAQADRREKFNKAFAEAMTTGKPAVLKRCLSRIKPQDKYALLNPPPHSNSLPLFKALSAHHNKLARELINQGAGINYPFLIAAYKGKEDIIKCLIETYEADVNTHDTKGFTALMFAAQNGHEAVIKLLLGEKAEVNIRNQEGLTALMAAAKNGHEVIVKLLIAAEADVDVRNEQGFTALMAASRNGHAEIATCLIEAGADINAKQKEGFSALMFAASEKGNLVVVERLIAAGADLDAKDVKGWTSLMFAAQNGYADIVACLIKAGANVNAVSDEAISALMAASQNGHISIVEKLIEEGANVNATSAKEWTSLMFAAQNGYAEIVSCLIEAGANVNAKQKEGFTALMYAAQNKHISIVEKLIEEGANVNATSAKGWTSLMFASHKGHKAIIEKLIKEGANFNAKDTKGFTALMIASQYGHQDIVAYLIKRVDDVNIKSNNGLTALMLAAKYEHPEIAACLIEGGADVNDRDSKGWTPLMLAADNGGRAIVELLVKAKAEVDNISKEKFTALMLAARNGHTSIVKFLIAAEAKVNTICKEGTTALMIASQNGHQAIVNCLIEDGADINIKSSEGWTALMLAAKNGHISIVDSLIKAGADVNAASTAGWTPLMLASAGEGHPVVVQRLIEAGADINAQDAKGWSALIFAAKNGHPNIVKKLMEEGADLDARDAKGWSALMFASQNGYVDIVELLLEKKAEINARNNEGLTALIAASQNGYISIVEKLIEKGANVNAQDIIGSTALMFASQNGNEDIVKLLIAGKAEVNARNKEGITALMLASQNGNISIVENLIEEGADVNIKSDNGLTALMLSVRNQYEAIATKLIEVGADVNAKDAQEWTSLMHASQNGNEDIVKLLIAGKAEVNASNKEGWTSLMHASQDGYADIVKLLLAEEAEVNAMNKEGVTALMAASKNGYISIVENLIEEGANVNAASVEGWTSLMYASQNGNISIVEKLIEEGANVNAASVEGWTALMFASHKGHKIIVEKLIKEGANLNATSSEGWTSLMLASSREGNPNIVQKLIEEGAELDVQDAIGSTALMYAAQDGCVDVVRQLIAAGANINIVNSAKYTALMIASQNEHKDIVELLKAKETEDRGNNEGSVDLVPESQDHKIDSGDSNNTENTDCLPLMGE